jgi:hypothetical protein
MLCYTPNKTKVLSLRQRAPIKCARQKQQSAVLWRQPIARLRKTPLDTASIPKKNIAASPVSCLTRRTSRGISKIRKTKRIAATAAHLHASSPQNVGADRAQKEDDMSTRRTDRQAEKQTPACP